MKEASAKKIYTKVQVGGRYGHLEVVKDLGFDDTNHHYYSCICHRCGRESRELREKITKGRTNARICCKQCSSTKDRTGFERDGYKTVHIADGTTRDRHSRWVCQCIICGEMKVFSTKQLIGKSPLPKCLHINTKDFFNSCIDCQITAKLRKI